MKQTTYLSSLRDISTLFDAFILDLWGVVHDGKSLYPGTLDALKKLRKAGKKITFLSNAPRRASVVAESLAGMGVNADLYDAIVTSGETAYRCLEHPENSPFKPRGHKYLYIGLERDRLILKGLHYEEVKHPEHAQFVMLSHSFEDNQPIKTLHPLLEKCVKLALPVVCINPDREVVRLTGERVYCAGALAQEYRMMGGEVVYFGKPHRAVYERCLATVAGVERSRIVAVGDSLSTDILGGERTKLATVLVTGGVLRETLGDAKAADFKEKCAGLFELEQVTPHYVIPALQY
jgi:HAD superfamily hydrolase (TIGR01459 family)